MPFDPAPPSWKLEAPSCEPDAANVPDDPFASAASAGTKCGRGSGSGRDLGGGNNGSSSSGSGSANFGGRQSDHGEISAEVTMKRGRGTTTGGADAAASAGLKCGRAAGNDLGFGGGGGGDFGACGRPGDTNRSVTTSSSTSGWGNHDTGMNSHSPSAWSASEAAQKADEGSVSLTPRQMGLESPLIRWCPQMVDAIRMAVRGFNCSPSVRPHGFD